MSVQFNSDQVFVHLHDRSEGRQNDQAGANHKGERWQNCEIDSNCLHISFLVRPIDNEFQIDERDRFTTSNGCHFLQERPPFFSANSP
jgi:hypothetical protein